MIKYDLRSPKSELRWFQSILRGIFDKAKTFNYAKATTAESTDQFLCQSLRNDREASEELCC